MSALLKIGTPVKTASIQGEVIGMTVSDDKQEMQYLVAFKGLDGVAHERHFRPEEIEVA